MTTQAFPEFQPSKSEEFSKARVLIDIPTADHGDIPYTRKPGGCGIEGDYIHFTPNYLTKDPDQQDRPGEICCKSI